MNQYLFLFPIRKYFGSCLNSAVVELDGHNVSELFDLINARYRNRRYGINWLLFGVEGDEDKPDMTNVPQYVDIRACDRLLSAGISFSDLERGIYANPGFVLDQLPRHKRLVLGGFHQSDCVDQLARRSYKRGVDTFVDEDTTDLFFSRHALGEIPLIRRSWSLKRLGIPAYLYQEVVRLRKNKPWLTQS
jgi:hypothetical protein